MRYMLWVEASIAEIRQEDGLSLVMIECPVHAIPMAGQYALANLPVHTPADAYAATAVMLFPTLLGPSGFCAMPAYPDANRCQLPPGWQPGERLHLRSPLGQGFCLPSDVRHLALVAAGNSVGRLLPLLAQAATRKADIVLFTDLASASLPSSVEIYPLHSFAEIVPWADFVAVDLFLDELSSLRKQLGFSPEFVFPCAAQALVLSAMPCAGLAKCGACALPTRQGHRLVCEDGPVFALSQLAW